MQVCDKCRSVEKSHAPSDVRVVVQVLVPNKDRVSYRQHGSALSLHLCQRCLGEVMDGLSIASILGKGGV